MKKSIINYVIGYLVGNVIGENPIIHWEDGSMTTVPEDELPLLLPETDEIKPSGTESPLANIDAFVNVIDEKTGMKGRRETNTMPQWAGSCWYYLRYIDPHNEK